ncbi:MAG: SH3 domain-containing protein [Clostridia bacterium]|nr:SH3 domain-containing protein [Clostridia bacterium]
MNKRFLSSLTVVMLLVVTLLFTHVAPASASYVVYSNCGNGKPLNVREGPGKDYWIMDKIPYGNPIVVDGETDPGWLHVSSGGYVQASLTSRTYPGPYVPPSPAPSPSTSTSSDYNSVFRSARFVTPYTVTLTDTPNSNGKANVRWAPSKYATLQKAYPSGTQVRVLAELGNWYQVEDAINEMVGFVHKSYVNR